MKLMYSPRAIILISLCLSTLAQESTVLIDKGQEEPLETGEVELSNATEVDKEFDDKLLSIESRPATLPTVEEVKRLYSDQKIRIEEEISNLTIASTCVDFELNAKYYTYKDWFISVYKCCPPHQNYGCRSHYTKLGCFSNYANGYREWCCPFWPSTYIANCNCSKCAVLNSNCASVGNCYRRYTYRFVYTVCYVEKFWSYIRWFYLYLPTSCYCHAHC